MMFKQQLHLENIVEDHLWVIPILLWHIGVWIREDKRRLFNVKVIVVVDIHLKINIRIIRIQASQVQLLRIIPYLHYLLPLITLGNRHIQLLNPAQVIIHETCMDVLSHIGPRGQGLHVQLHHIIAILHNHRLCKLGVTIVIRLRQCHMDHYEILLLVTEMHLRTMQHNGYIIEIHRPLGHKVNTQILCNMHQMDITVIPRNIDIIHRLLEDITDNLRLQMPTCILLMCPRLNYMLHRNMNLLHIVLIRTTLSIHLG